MPNQVLNFHDVQLYDTDVALFRSNQWLNDNAINFYFTYIYHTVCLPPVSASGDGSKTPTTGDVLLMDPAVVSCMMLQCDDDDEYAELGHGLQISHKSLCFLPVNDNESFDGESSHWSLLVFENQRFTHYDSSAGHNTSAAKRIAKMFLQLLHASGVENVPKWSSDVFANARDAPQQRNGYDCGMYVLAVAEFLTRQHCELSSSTGELLGQSLLEYVTPERVTTLRRAIPAIVSQLQEETRQL